MSSDAMELIDHSKMMRLRHWARENYAPKERRKSYWHPLVLKEMERRDSQLEHDDDACPFAMSAASRFVPLSPQPIYTLHEAHAELPAPHFLRTPAAADSAYDEPYYIPG